MINIRSKFAHAWFAGIFLVSLTLCFPVRGASAQKAQSANGIVRFTILHLNDVYEITPVSGEGGLARVATLRRRLLRDNPLTITVLAGDMFSPSALGTAKANGEALAGKQIVAVMNAVGLDYMTFGNHEFDPSEKQFKQRMAETKFQWVSSNVTDAAGIPFPKAPEYRIFKLQDSVGQTVTVGMFGLTIDSNRKPYVLYSDPFQAAEKQVKFLRPRVDVLLAMTHQSFEDDRKLSEMFPQIDLIIGGHEHEHHVLEIGSQPPIYKADANARTVYLHYFAYNRKTHKLLRNSILRRVGLDIAEDPGVKKEEERWVKVAFDGFHKEGFNPRRTIVKTPIPLDGLESSVRSRPTALTKIIAEGMLKEAPEADLAIFNGGSIRIDDTLPPGPITEYDVIRILPFGGKVVLVEVKGDLLERALNQGLENKGIGGYLQSARTAYNPDSKTWTIAGAALDPNRSYKLAVNDFLLTGREQGLDFFSSKNPDVKMIREGQDIRQTTISALQSAFRNGPGR